MSDSKIPHLSGRLETIARLCTPCERLIDVGCDHAYLPVAMVLRGSAQRAAMTDINRGPYQKALNLVKKAGLESRCEVYCCDGLGPLRPSSGDALVIAGMGGYEIAGILKQKELPPDLRMVLQANWSYEPLRMFLAEGGYHIHEQIVEDKGRMYVLFLPEAGAIPRRLSLTEAAVGEYWLQKPPESFSELEKKWQLRLLRLLLLRQKKYPEYHEVCPVLQGLCRNFQHAL